MSRAPQQRSISTKASLLKAARDIVVASSFTDMRVEEVVLRAGVAKGTFFSHFKDKDAIMVALIGEDLATVMDLMRAAPAPTDAATMVDALAPLIAIIGAERTVFEIVVRHSGAMSITDIGPIGQNFIDQVHLFAGWIAPLQGTIYRTDVAPELLAEGIQAFVIQCIAMNFCLVESETPLADRLRAYLVPWLSAPKS